MQRTNALIKKACFTVKNASCRPPLHQHHGSWFLCLSLSRYLSVSLVSLFSTSVPPPAAVSLFLFLYLLLEGDTPYTHTALTLSEQLMLETREREKERGRRKTNKGNGKMHSSKPKEIERRNLIICLFLSSAHSPHLHLCLSLCNG